MPPFPAAARPSSRAICHQSSRLQFAEQDASRTGRRRKKKRSIGAAKRLVSPRLSPSTGGREFGSLQRNIGYRAASRRTLQATPPKPERVDFMRKLAIGAALVALTAATPAFADGGKGSSRGDALTRHLTQVISATWRSAFSTPPGFSSPGRHSGWTQGKHWGWFKPKNPHWPHDPVSP